MLDNKYKLIVDEIQSLPSGGITYKKINGKRYAYYQWRVNGKQKSRRAKDDELDSLIDQIERRKHLQLILKENGFEYTPESKSDYQFHCALRIGQELDNFAEPVVKWKKRECYKQLYEYIYGDISDRVYILYGLRRTGKTTLIRQVIAGMDLEMRSRTAFIQVQESKTLNDVNQDLKYLEKQGYKYIFIDEVTLLADFTEGAALLSDVFATSGMKIVLSGTDSLGFMFAEDEELYDRCIMTHTTFIPYREFEYVLGVSGIDNYIKYGGTMSLGGRNYNEKSMIFSTKQSTDEYVDSAIARNIQHSLKHYQYGTHFRSLSDLYEKRELTNVINRIVEDFNHRFTIEVLTKDFESGDLKISASNLRKDRGKPTDILDTVDQKKINQTLKSLLEILNKTEQTVDIQDSHRYEIKEYLELLDLIKDIEIRWMSDFNKRDKRTIFSQPGMRYSQAEALIKSLMQDELFRNISFDERKRITERIISEIKGRMMEDIVLLETKISRKNCEVFKLQFAVGEFDMVVFDPEGGFCEIYEIKHSKEAVPEQCKHLLNQKKCDETEFRYGRIKSKTVIYRGPTTELKAVDPTVNDEIVYVNVEEYLKELA